MEKDQRKKMQPVDCTNDYQMVLAGLRPPIVKKEITERDHFSVVKEAKKKYNKLKENTVEFLKQRDELVRAFLKSDMPKWGSFTFQVK